MPSRSTAYDELLALLTSSPSPEDILNYTPTPMTVERVRYLLDGHEAGTLTARELGELDALWQLITFKRMANLQAMRRGNKPAT
ncbi:MAG: hypothetical protein GYB66_08455 [Chloroflexi bacterium]|nr:hypothetical protein [Chloroflexota bacterium]